MRIRGFIRDQQAHTAVEFGLVSLVFISSMLGIIDMGRLAYEMNAAKAAARHGARVAVISAPAVAELVDFDAVSSCSLAGGEPVPQGACGIVDYACTSGGCGGGTLVSANFNAVVTAMQGYYPRLQPGNVEIDYRHRGLGTSGFIGSDVEPLVTVRVINLTFQAISLQIFGVGALPIPSAATTLTAESQGATSAAI